MNHSIRILAVAAAMMCVGCPATDDPTKTGDTGMDPMVTDADMDGVPVDGDCDDNDATLLAIADDADCDGILTADDCDDDDSTSTAIADDADCDGILTADDCDDADAASTAIADDGDCDGTLTADDCDDADATSTVVADDADCDGTLTADDCDDADATSTIIADDGDCDGTLTADDCDDADAASTIIADDGDCDGVLTADDCDDADAASTTVATDADCDGVLTADDCDDTDPLLPPVDDFDCDRFLASVDDCDDNDATIFPGAPEVPGDGVDQDCDLADVASTVFILNEFHYDPEGGDPANPGEGGDANYNGIREAQTDEFVELVNTAAVPIDISGFEFFEENEDPTSGNPRHTVPPGTVIAPGQAFVLFGSEEVSPTVGPSMAGIDQRELLPDGSPNPGFGTTTFDFGGAVVQGCNGLDLRLNLNNNNDSIFVVDSTGNNYLAFDLRDLGGSDQSVTLDPDITGVFTPHNDIAANPVNFSPGTRNDGTAF